MAERKAYVDKQIRGQLFFKAATELTLDTDGEITVVQSLHTVDTFEDAASDDLVTINGGKSDSMLYLRAAHTDRTVVIKHGTGNILTADGSDYSLDSADKIVEFVYDGSNWRLCGPTGDVSAAANITDHAIVRGDGGAKGIQGSVPTIDDAGNLDMGNHSVDNVSSLTDTGLTSGRVIIAGAGGLLADDAGLTFGSNLLTVTKTAIGVTQGDYGLALANTTAAASGAQQYSPPIRWHGLGWETDGSSSMAVDFRAFVRPIEGAAAPTGGLDFQASINDGAYSNLLTVLSNGNVGIGTTDPQNLLYLAQTNNTTLNGGTYISLGFNENGVGGYHLIGFGYGSNAGSSYKPAYLGYVETNNSSGTAGDLVFLTRPAGHAGTVSPTEQVRITNNGNVGIRTTGPGQILDCNSGSGNMIADGYDSHPSTYAFKENAIAVIGAGMIDRLKSFKLFEFTRKPFVSAEELKEATVKHFSKVRWVKAFGGEVVKDENGVETIQGDDYRHGKLRTCPDEGMLAFIDAHAEKLREERRSLPVYTRKHLGPILDDPGTKEALGDVIHYDEDGKITGYSLNDQVGFLEGCLREVVDIALDLADRVKVVEAA